jgi:hypothetical protein
MEELPDGGHRLGDQQLSEPVLIRAAEDQPRRRRMPQVLFRRPAAGLFSLSKGGPLP